MAAALGWRTGVLQAEQTVSAGSTHAIHALPLTEVTLSHHCWLVRKMLSFSATFITQHCCSANPGMYAQPGVMSLTKPAHCTSIQPLLTLQGSVLHQYSTVLATMHLLL